MAFGMVMWVYQSICLTAGLSVQQFASWTALDFCTDIQSHWSMNPQDPQIASVFFVFLIPATHRKLYIIHTLSLMLTHHAISKFGSCRDCHLDYDGMFKSKYTLNNLLWDIFSTFGIQKWINLHSCLSAWLQRRSAGVTSIFHRQIYCKSDICVIIMPQIVWFWSSRAFKEVILCKF